VDTGVELDPTGVEFNERLRSRFADHAPILAVRS